jgi:hypothetical protein
MTCPDSTAESQEAVEVVEEAVEEVVEALQGRTSAHLVFHSLGNILLGDPPAAQQL